MYNRLLDTNFHMQLIMSKKIQFIFKKKNVFYVGPDTNKVRLSRSRAPDPAKFFS